MKFYLHNLIKHEIERGPLVSRFRSKIPSSKKQSETHSDNHRLQAIGDAVGRVQFHRRRRHIRHYVEQFDAIRLV